MDKARLARWWLYPQRDCREALSTTCICAPLAACEGPSQNQGGNMENNAGKVNHHLKKLRVRSRDQRLAYSNEAVELLLE